MVQNPCVVFDFGVNLPRKKADEMILLIINLCSEGEDRSFAHVSGSSDMTRKATTQRDSCNAYRYIR